MSLTPRLPLLLRPPNCFFETVPTDPRIPGVPCHASGLRSSWTGHSWGPDFLFPSRTGGWGLPISLDGTPSHWRQAPRGRGLLETPVLFASGVQGTIFNVEDPLSSGSLPFSACLFPSKRTRDTRPLVEPPEPRTSSFTPTPRRRLETQRYRSSPS